VEIFRALGTEPDIADEDTWTDPDEPTGVHFWTEHPSSPESLPFAPTDVSPVVIALAHPRLIPRALRASAEDIELDFSEEIATNPSS
jgi:hypothetical protein